MAAIELDRTDRGADDALPMLTVTGSAVVIPLVVIAVLRRRV